MNRTSHLAAVLLALAVSAASSAQEPALYGARNEGPLESYRFETAVPVVECTFEGTPVTGEAVQAPSRSSFLYLDEVPQTDAVTIRFLRWDPTNARSQSNFRQFNIRSSSRTVAGGGSETVYYEPTFCIPRSYVDDFARRRYSVGRNSGHLTTGVLVLPVKFRPASDDRPFDFSKDFSVGTTAGWRVRTHPFREVYASALVGVALSSVRLDSVNTLGAVREGTDRAALTWTLGAMIDVDRFQIGAFVGWDRISQPNQTDWVYQGQPWIAIGLGYSILSAPPSTTAAASQ